MQSRLMKSRLNQLVHSDYIWLLLSFVLSLFSFGPLATPLAPWLQLIVGLRFLRLRPSWRGFLWTWLAGSASMLIVGRGLIPIPSPFFEVFAILSNLLPLLIYVVDRLVTPRIPGFASTLVLPSAAVAYGYIDALYLNGYGTWGNLANTQIDSPALTQSVSFVGLWGLVFLMHWVATVVNWAWQQNFEMPKVRNGLALCASVLALLVMAGSLRLSISEPTAQTVRVAAIVPSNLKMLQNLDMAIFGQLTSGKAYSEADRTALHNFNQSATDSLFALSEREANNGARFIFWPEGALLLLAEDEAQLVERGSQLAKIEGVYLGMAYAVFHQGQKAENKVVVVDPAGKVALNYLKTNLVPFAEDAIFVQGDGRLPVLDTPYGRIAVAICHDLDHFDFMQQAGEQNVDIVFAPTGDWADIKRVHLGMFALRAIEQGFTLVRPTRGGISAVVDPQGRILASLDRGDAHFDGRIANAEVPAETSVLVGEAPVKGVVTIYRIVKDTLAWLSIVLLLGLCGWAAVGKLSGWKVGYPRVQEVN